MLTSAAQEILDGWTDDTRKVFYYYNNVYSPDVVILLRVDKDKYICDKYQSSTEIDDMNEETLLKQLTKESLVFIENFNYYMDYTQLRTGGCQCGAWLSHEKEHHSFWCPKNIRQ